jgi:hypothetical protein
MDPRSGIERKYRALEKGEAETKRASRVDKVEKMVWRFTFSARR